MSEYGDPTQGGIDPSAQSGSEDPFEGLSEFGKNYIQTRVTDESHRPIVAQHLREWDKGANSQFQKIHNDYRPYRDLGDIQTLQQSVNFVRRMQADPVGTLRMLVEGEFIKPEDLHGLIPQQTSPQGGNVEEGSDLEKTLAKLLDQRLGGVTKQTETLQQQLEAFQREQLQNQGRQELDKAINTLKSKYGSDWDDFTENQVLALAANAQIPLDQAAEMVFSGLNQYAQKKVPPRAGFSMPGVGSPASFNRKPEDLNDEDARKAYVAQELMRRMQQSR